MPEGKYGFQTKAFDSNTNLTLRHLSIAEWKPMQLGQLFFHSIVLMSCRRKSGPSLKDQETTSPGLSLSVGLQGMIGSLALNELCCTARWITEADKLSRHVKMQSYFSSSNLYT